MTIKLAKEFNNSIGEGMLNVVTMSSTLPLTLHSNLSYHTPYYQHQQQITNQYYSMENDFAVNDNGDEIYHHSGNEINGIMDRDHHYNNSQRPLLTERKTSFLPTKQQSKLRISKEEKGKPKPLQQVPLILSQHHVSQLKSYLPAYMPQEKRDSAKGLHGFNDFNMLSQQYNEHLLYSPHIGYPYGSPPSPTAKSSDFVFDTAIANTQSNITEASKNDNDTHSGLPQGHSRFEDDFCSGPFIFGVPYEQQMDHSILNAGLQQIETLHCKKTFKLNTNIPNSDLENNLKTLTPPTYDTNSISRDADAKGIKFFLKKLKSKNTKTKSNNDDTPIKSEVGIKPHIPRQPTIKCVVVGDGAVGKTNLILSYLENTFNPEHVPTASDIYNADVMVNDSPVHVIICDTAGQDTLDPLRELCYPDCDVFILCFSVAKPETFYAIKTKWAPKFVKSKAILVLVGTQCDLRTDINVIQKLQDNREKPVPYADAWDFATSIGAKYIETSSAKQEKVKDVFDTAIWEGLSLKTLSPKIPFWKKMLCLA